MGVMHEADCTYSIWSTWACYWLDRFLKLALNRWILSKFAWICLLFILLIFVGVELPLCIVVTILECSYLFSGVKQSKRSFLFYFDVLIVCVSVKQITSYFKRCLNLLSSQFTLLTHPPLGFQNEVMRA